MTRQFALPQSSLTPHVRHLMWGDFDDESVILPACADVQLLVYLRGGALLIDGKGAEERLPASFLVGAVSHPRRYRVEPDSRFAALTFRPGGLHACFGISAADVTGKIIAFDTAGSMTAALARSADAMVPAVMQEIVQRCLQTARPTPPFPTLDPDALRMPVKSIACRLGISTRQFERRCLAALGMSWRDYLRLARYSSAMAAIMAEGGCSQSLALLAQDAGYADQAHLTRDFAELAGQPPGRFLAQRERVEYRLWQFSGEELASYLL